MTASPALARHEFAGIAVTVGAALIYGFYPAATRGLYIEGGNAIFLTMLSLFARALVLVVFCLATGKKLFSSREHTKAGIINGAYQFASIGCILWAMIYLPGPVVVTIMFTYATMLYVYMVLRGEEPYSLSTLGTVIAALVGVAMVMNIFHTDGITSIKGTVIALVSAVVVAARIHKFGTAFKTLNPPVVGAETFICAFLFSCLLPLFGPVALPHTDAGWGWAALSSASLAFGGFAALYGIALLGPFRFAFFIKLEPALGALFAALLIGEILMPVQYGGIALVVGSLLVYQLLQKAIETMSKKNILVIKHSAFGDFVQALGIMRAIRAHHKNDKITLLTTKPFVRLAEASKYFDAVVVDMRPRWYQLLRLLVFKKFLNDGKFTRVYDLQNSERTGLYLSLFKRIPEWNGIAFSASHRIADDQGRKNMHVFDALRAQLAIAGINKITPDDLSWLDTDAFSLQLPRPYVLIAAGCSPQHVRKRWRAERYIEICQWLAAQSFTPVLLGTADDADVNTAIATACPQAVDLTGRTAITDIPGLARAARAAFGNDTGPIQMIGPTGCKTLGLYPSFSNPRRHGPLGTNVVTILGDTMDAISVDDVKGAMTPLLEA